MSGAKKLNNKTEAKGCDILHITTRLINTLYALAVETIIIMCTFHKGPVYCIQETLHLLCETPDCSKEYGYKSVLANNVVRRCPGLDVRSRLQRSVIFLRAGLVTDSVLL